jgi:hypothetical protein
MAFLAGLGYAMCCRLLNQAPTRKPGDTISEQQLQQLMTEAIAKGSRSPACSLAERLVALATTTLVGSWHTLPDLVTCLSTNQAWNSSQAGLFEGLIGKSMQAMQDSIQQEFNPLVEAAVTQLLIRSCTQPGDPILAEDMPGFDALTFANVQAR